MEKIFCQSCGMPMEKLNQFGTNADGTQNNDYCVYCYKDGEFTQDVTMDVMIENCLQYIDEFNKDSEKKMTVDEARNMMKEFFPALKRWKNK